MNSTNKKLLLLLAVLNVAVMLIMQSFNTSLKPYGIIAFEFAGTIECAQKMVSVWRSNDVLHEVFFLLGFDYVFMFTYATFLTLSCWLVSTQLHGKLSRIYLFVTFFQPLAALLDAVENAALYQLASGSSDDYWPLVSYWCAVPKFIIAILGVLAAAIGLILIYKKSR